MFNIMLNLKPVPILGNGDIANLEKSNSATKECLNQTKKLRNCTKL